MNGDAMLALIIGMIIGLIIVKGMVWLVTKARSQSRTSATVTRSSNGSIHIQAGDGEDLFITGNIRAGDGVGTKRKGGHHGGTDIEPALEKMESIMRESSEDEAANLKQNLLD